MATAGITPDVIPLALTAPTVALSSEGPNEPSPRRFNVDEYYRMGEAGVFKPDDRVELIRGAIVQTNPIGNRHAQCMNRLAVILVLAYEKVAEINICNPVCLDEISEPQPDFALLRVGSSPRTSHPSPSDVIVAIEVSDSSVRYDRNVKAPLYAESGIPEFWLIDLEAATIEVRRKPNRGAYEELLTPRRGEHLVCEAFPELRLDVAAILG